MANHGILGGFALTICPIIIISHRSPPETVVQGSLWCCTDPDERSPPMSKSESISWKLEFSASLQTIQTALDKSLVFHTCHVNVG